MDWLDPEQVRAQLNEFGDEDICRMTWTCKHEAMEQFVRALAKQNNEKIPVGVTLVARVIVEAMDERREPDGER